MGNDLIRTAAQSSASSDDLLFLCFEDVVAFTLFGAAWRPTCGLYIDVN